MSDLDTHFLRPGACARTPFGTRFFVLFTHPELDITGLCKRRMNRRMRAEMEAWEKLQSESKLSGNKSCVDALREDHVAVPEEAQMAGIPAIERAVGAESAVKEASNPDYTMPDADSPGDELGVNEATVPETESNDDRDTNAISTDADIVHEIAGFVVIDMAKPTESAFLDHTRGKVEPAEAPSSLWSGFLKLLRPASGMDW